MKFIHGRHGLASNEKHCKRLLLESKQSIASRSKFDDLQNQESFAQCDFFLFSKIKGHSFDTVTEYQAASQDVILTLRLADFR